MRPHPCNAIDGRLSLTFCTNCHREIGRRGKLACLDHSQFGSCNRVVVVRTTNAQPGRQVNFRQGRLVVRLARHAKPTATLTLSSDSPSDHGGGNSVGSVHETMWVSLLLTEASQFRVSLRQQATFLV